MRKAFRLIVTNRFIADEFAKRGFPRERVVVAPNGVDLTVFGINDSKAAAVQKLGISESLPNILSKRVLMYTGKLTTMGEDKGVADILSVLKKMQDPNTLFIAVGGTDAENKKYGKMADEMTLGPQVYFFGNQTKERLALFQRVADVLLMPFPKKAHYEYFMSPLKTFEYMASGRPIIASDLPSIREILSEETAVFSKPGEPESILRALALLENREFAERLANNAREKVKNYTWEERTKKLIAAYN